MTNDTPDLHQRAAGYVGKTVSFDHVVGGTVARLVGVIEKARYVGPTKRGAIPDYELTVRGASGKSLTISLVESYASINTP